MIPKCISAIGVTFAGNFLRRLMLSAVVVGSLGFIFFSTSRICGQSTTPAGAPLPSFEVASIKPNRSGDMRMRLGIRPGMFSATGVSAKLLITYAYNVQPFQLSGGPSWLDSEKYDIEAKEEDSLNEELQKLPPDQRDEPIRLRVQSLLADRFKLSLTRQAKELPVYALVVAKNGPKLQSAKPGDTYPNGFKGPDGRAHPGRMGMGPGQLAAQGVPLALLAQQLSQQLGRTVLDQTGLKGNYDFELKWTPDQSPGAMPMSPEGIRPGSDNAPPPDSSGPSIFTAIQEQLGLKLEPTRGPVEVLVINHIERPSED